MLYTKHLKLGMGQGGRSDQENMVTNARVVAICVGGKKKQKDKATSTLILY